MFSEDRKNKGFYVESDAGLSAKFLESGMGACIDEKHLFHPLEAAFLVKEAKSSFSKMTLAEFIQYQEKREKGFTFAFATYHMIRKTGRIVRPYPKSSGFFRVYSPGVGREENRPSQLLCLLPGNLPSTKTIEQKVKIAHLARLDLIIASGSEKEIRFHKVSAFNF